jgi:hypothetical protein
MGLSAHQRSDSCMRTKMGFMVGIWVMFGVVVGPVFGACIPVIMKLVLRCMAMEPSELHIHHFAPARNNSFIGNPRCSGVISLDRTFRLGPTHVNKVLVVGNHLSCCDE